MQKFWDSPIDLRPADDDDDTRSDGSLKMSSESGETRKSYPTSSAQPNRFAFEIEDKRGRMHRFICAVTKISACHHLEDILEGLVVSPCKFTTLLNPSLVEDPILAFGDDMKERMATVTVFTIANRYGDYIRTR